MGLLDKILGKKANDTVRVEIKPFIEQHGPYMSTDLYFDLLELSFTQTHSTLPRELYDDIRAKKEKMDRFNESLFKATELNNKGIALEKEGKIDEAIAVYEQNIAGDCYPAHHSFDRLIILYGKRKDLDNKRRVLLRAIEVFGKGNTDGAKEYMGKLAAMDKPQPVYPKQAKLFHVDGMTLFARLNEMQRQMPEFKFYSTDAEPPRFQEYFKKERFEISRQFSKWLEEADYQDHCGRYDLSAELYERLVSEEYPFSKPYDRLVIIYGKAGLKDDVIRVLQSGINFFSELRQEQYEYVSRLAAKYGKMDFWNERYKASQKITYYYGAFELYNPYPCVERFQQRLNQIR